MNREYAVARNDGRGWYDIYYRDVERSRSGELRSIGGFRMVVACAYGAERALALASHIADIENGMLRKQTADDISSQVEA